jgi:hypothetical protein
VNSPSEEPKAKRPVIGDQAMIHINGAVFRCDCGANVFTKLVGNRYQCNGCSALYIGELKTDPGNGSA